MEKYEINKNIENFNIKINELANSLNINKLKDSIKEYDEIISSSSIWDDPKYAEDIINKANLLKEKFSSYNELLNNLNDLKELILLSDEIEGLDKEIEDNINNLNEKINSFETMILLNSKYDDYDVIMELHPGQGGTEALDWVEMLFRMYTLYAKSHNLKMNILNYEQGDLAGIKSVSVEIKGPNAYGLLKSERGVHRLVRISPFDSNKRRHTTFASVDIAPIIKNDLDIEIKDEDLRIDTYMSSGHGGQGVNTTYSAVRVTYLPLNIVVTCQNERSQLRNKDSAIKVLKSKLLEIELLKVELNLKEIKGQQLQIGFGSQIRSYVFTPYTMVKDHRTNYETSDIKGVMDGNIDDFIRSYLSMKASEKHE